MCLSYFDIFQKNNDVIKVNSNKVVDIFLKHMCYISCKLCWCYFNLIGATIYLYSSKLY